MMVILISNNNMKTMIRCFKIHRIECMPFHNIFKILYLLDTMIYITPELIKELFVSNIYYWDFYLDLFNFDKLVINTHTKEMISIEWSNKVMLWKKIFKKSSVTKKKLVLQSNSRMYFLAQKWLKWKVLNQMRNVVHLQDYTVIPNVYLSIMSSKNSD